MTIQISIFYFSKDPAHSCDIYFDGSHAAIGTETGRWHVIDLNTREIVTSHTDGNEQIETVQYSPGLCNNNHVLTVFSLAI